jgi:hypothetical protein
MFMKTQVKMTKCTAIIARYWTKMLPLCAHQNEQGSPQAWSGFREKTPPGGRLPIRHTVRLPPWSGRAGPAAMTNQYPDLLNGGRATLP